MSDDFNGCELRAGRTQKEMGLTYFRLLYRQSRFRLKKDLNSLSYIPVQIRTRRLPNTSQKCLCFSQVSQYKTRKVYPSLRYICFKIAILLYTALVLMSIYFSHKACGGTQEPFHRIINSVISQSHLLLATNRICFVIYEKAICDTNWIRGRMH